MTTMIETASAPLVMEFSIAGPCLTLGRLVRETAQFYVYAEWKGGSNFGRERRVAKRTDERYSSAHIEPCRGCTAHPQTSYPNGYMD